MTKRKVTCARYLSATSDLREALETCKQERSPFQYVVIPPYHPGLTREAVVHSADRPISRSCRLLDSNDWTTLVVAEISRSIDVDSPDTGFRQRSEEILLQELNYSAHLNFSAVIVRLTSNRCTNLASVILSWLMENPHAHVWVQVPLENPEVAHMNERSDVWPDGDQLPTWEWWNHFRFICDFHPRLGVVLSVGNDLPASSDRDRWPAEPVRAVFLRTSLFQTNRRGYPVLPPAHQLFLREFAELGTQVILGGENRHESLACYAYYLNYVWNLGMVGDNADIDDSAWADFLQSPLQPLMNNLEAQTYEVFEKDPVKYRVYRDAIHDALLDRVPEENKDDVVTVIMVMGAGRGPIVQSALEAGDKANRKIKVYAVEKNPNAVITLQCRRDEEWQGRVTVIAGDMRHLELLEKADILVSELLGSFGDNELSPECLDGAQKYLKDDGISIPCDYTSHVCPVMSHKLFAEARACPVESGKPQSASLETPYVVLQRNKLFLDKPVPLFKFHHPNREKTIDNSRYDQKIFIISRNAVLHGFSGFFHTTLYKEHILSIVPDTFSKGMFSWFPMFMPLSHPVMVFAGAELIAHFWRRVSSRDVWYEWTISSPVPMPVHNIKGRSSKIGL